MSDLLLYSKISSLQENLRAEVIDFIEFLEKKYETKKVHPKAGCMQGTFVLSKDFDEPLEDFKEYM